jgi:predicted metal-dependent enzyme (double-stranded beta helix superfamily)
LVSCAFNLDQFVAACGEAVEEHAPTKAVRELLARAVDDPPAVLAELGTPTRGEVQRLFVSDELTVINVIWAPGMMIMPHNHNMWAVIGVYGGREDNIFWRRCNDDPDGVIEAAGAKSIGPKEVRPLGDDVIHSVSNPTSRFTAAIHVYGGNFFAEERSEWDPESLHEHPYDIEKNMALFERANANL